MRRFKYFAGLIIGVLIFSFVVAAATPAPYTLRLQPFLTGLTRPVLIRHAGDNSKRLFIVQQTGIIKVLQPGSTTPTDFINLSSKIIVPVSLSDERGLLGLTFHPQFAANGKFYVNYTRAGDGATVIAEYKLATGSPNQGDITTERILLTIPQPFSNHNGGMVEFGFDGYLYIGMGDGGSGNDPNNNAQNRARLLGKMLRIDVNIPTGSTVPYLIPPTNPFTGANTARCDGGSGTTGVACQEIWTIGMRNPFRWSFDRGGTHQLYAGDVGQDAVEEADIITGGANYGWRVYEGTNCTNLDPSLCTASNFTAPILQYSSASPDPRCAITGGYVYRGTQGNLPFGAYIYADYCTGEILSFQNNASTLLLDSPRLIASFGEDEDGELYVCGLNGTVDKITRAKASADTDGDLKTDLSVFRPSTGVWYAFNSSDNTVRIQQFGQNGDVSAPEDYDGDNITDIGIFRPSTGDWYYFRSSNATVGIIHWGQNGDVATAADYDGDAKADLAVFRPSEGNWYILKSSGSYSILKFGQSGDKPAVGDYDGDGKADIAVYRPSEGVWYALQSTNFSARIVRFGAAADIPAQGDFDFDGRTDFAVYRPSEGNWYILNSSTGAATIIRWGIAEDIPTVGDYDGDGKDDVAVWRPSTGTWYALRSSNNSALIAQFGQSGDLPSAAYDVP